MTSTLRSRDVRELARVADADVGRRRARRHRGGEGGHAARQLLGLAREQARRIALADGALDGAAAGVGLLARDLDQDRREHQQERAAERLGLAFDLLAQPDQLAEDVRHVARRIVVLARRGSWCARACLTRSSERCGDVGGVGDERRARGGRHRRRLERGELDGRAGWRRRRGRWRRAAPPRRAWCPSRRTDRARPCRRARVSASRRRHEQRMEARRIAVKAVRQLARVGLVGDGERLGEQAAPARVARRDDAAAAERRAARRGR